MSITYYLIPLRITRNRYRPFTNEIQLFSLSLMRMDYNSKYVYCLLNNYVGGVSILSLQWVFFFNLLSARLERNHSDKFKNLCSLKGNTWVVFVRVNILWTMSYHIIKLPLFKETSKCVLVLFIQYFEPCLIDMSLAYMHQLSFRINPLLHFYLCYLYTYIHIIMINFTVL